jgi:hypothetical protein
MNKKPLHIKCITEPAREALLKWIEDRREKRARKNDLADIIANEFEVFKEHAHSNKCVHNRNSWRRNDKISNREYKFEECMGKGDEEEETNEEPVDLDKAYRLLQSMKPIEIPVTRPSGRPPPNKGRNRLLNARFLLNQQKGITGAHLRKKKTQTTQQKKERGWGRGGKTKKRKKIKRKTRRKRN